MSEWRDPITDGSEEPARLDKVRGIAQRAEAGLYAGNLYHLLEDLARALDGPEATEEGHGRAEG
jgi:hypothetical protein